jgi:hypothetical protein
MLPRFNNTTRALALISLAACAAVILVALRSNHAETSAASEQADLQTSQFSLPEIERPPAYYTGKW